MANVATIRTEDRISTAEFAKALGITTDAAKILCQRNQLDAVKVGGQYGVWLIAKSEIARYKRERRNPGRPVRDD